MATARYSLVYVLDNERVVNPFGALVFVLDAATREMWLPVSWVFAELLSNPDTFRTRNRKHPCTMKKLSTEYPPSMTDFIFTNDVLDAYHQQRHRTERMGKRRLYMMRLDTLIHTFSSPVYKDRLSFHPRYTLAARVSMTRTLMRILYREKPRRATALKERLRAELQEKRKRSDTNNVLARVAALKDEILSGKEEREPAAPK